MVLKSMAASLLTIIGSKFFLYNGTSFNYNVKLELESGRWQSSLAKMLNYFADSPYIKTEASLRLYNELQKLVPAES